MEQNNDVKQQNIFECKELVETMCYSQQSLAEFGSNNNHGHTFLQHLLVSNQAHQEYATTSQNLSAQQTQFESNCATTPANVEIKPVNSIMQTRNISPKSTDPQITSGPLTNSFAVMHSNGSISSSSNSQVITAAFPKILATQGIEMINAPKLNVTVSKKNPKPVERPKNFRAVEFVLNNLDSVPGEEKFYSWSNKAREFANIQLSKESREKFYTQKIHSNVVNSSELHSDQLTSDVMIDNEQQETDFFRDETSKGKGKSDDRSSPKKKKMSKKSLKNINFAAERDRTLKKYSKNLMRKKPKSWQPQERNINEDLSSDI